LPAFSPFTLPPDQRDVDRSNGAIRFQDRRIARYNPLMRSPARFPPTLGAGARVALVAPSGPLRDASDLERAKSNVRALGWEPLVGEHVLERHGYLAGTDEHRLADLNRFGTDDSIDAVWCLRGGYGAARLLDGIDYDGWSRRARALIGYSDITALHAAIGQRANIVTYHGPTARAELTAFTQSSFADVMALGDDGMCRVQHDTIRTLLPGTATGRLVGGNLALVVSLLGTPYAWDLDGAILVLEDVSEQVYRIDRMLTQIRHSGARLAGLVFGGFTDIPHDTITGERPLGDVLAEFADDFGVPCVSGFPIGHVPDHVTLPLGALASLDADARTLLITREP
jgi:muramoyltetrapeptide carboxypeptidase